MIYLKLFESFNNDIKRFIKIGDFETNIIKHSDTYGDYNVTKFLTINLLDAIKEGQITKTNIGLEVGNIYSFILNNLSKLGSLKIVETEIETIGTQNIPNMEIYITLKEFNDKKLPIANSKDKVVNFLRKNLPELFI